ncbi:ribonuclease T2 [Shewanella morhuae]|uniref:Ribonuclease I n=1 Tax=Shewanella morhuae TaxID=365591 RepID=A0A380B292_9GAMM|nr:ribonuclease T2 [Shewanella morhuae]SUI90946.1 Ribonuclease I precursor [Shewanella morhuae]
MIKIFCLTISRIRLIVGLPNRPPRVLLTAFGLFGTLIIAVIPAFAAPASGEFIADKRCELFQSKNKQTNPDQWQSNIGERYPVLEILGNSLKPDWLRVRTNAIKSPMRWISGACGQYQSNIAGSNLSIPATAVEPAQTTTAADIKAKNRDSLKEHGATQKSQGDQCRISEKFDSNVLALSWQSTFCELYGSRKAECHALSQTSESTQWQHFSLHGLWPNKQQCGTRYGYCSTVKLQPNDFCTYPEFELNPSVRKNLEEVMPSARYGTCLERHQWWKHGTCRSQDPNEYFLLATQLTQAVNASAWVQGFIHERIGKNVTKSELNQSFDASFGKGAHTKMSLECAKGLLSEIRINLPEVIKTSDSLPSLLAKADKAKKGSCPETITIDRPN